MPKRPRTEDAIDYIVDRWETVDISNLDEVIDEFRYIARFKEPPRTRAGRSRVVRYLLEPVAEIIADKFVSDLVYYYLSGPFRDWYRPSHYDFINALVRLWVRRAIIEDEFDITKELVERAIVEAKVSPAVARIAAYNLWRSEIKWMRIVYEYARQIEVEWRRRGLLKFVAADGAGLGGFHKRLIYFDDVLRSWVEVEEGVPARREHYLYLVDDYVMVVPNEPCVPIVVLYSNIKRKNVLNREVPVPAIGVTLYFFTSRVTKSDLDRLYRCGKVAYTWVLDVDSKININQALRTVRNRGFEPVLVVETDKGYHIYLNYVAKTPERVYSDMYVLEKILGDPGHIVLAKRRQRRGNPIWGVVRVGGKYVSAKMDIVYDAVETIDNYCLRKWLCKVRELIQDYSTVSKKIVEVVERERVEAVGESELVTQLDI